MRRWEHGTEVGLDREFGRRWHGFAARRHGFTIFGRVGAVGSRHGSQNGVTQDSTGTPAVASAATAAMPTDTADT